MTTTKPSRLHTLLAAAAALTIGLGSTTAAQKSAAAAPVFQDAIGSWFGRAVPVPGQTICPPGAPGCPVPPEIVVTFTVGGDGTFIGSDATMLTDSTASSAHGQWERSGPRGIRAEVVLLQKQNGVLIGGVKNLFDATVVNRDEMQGSMEARLYAFTYGGTVNVDADGFPSPSPLAPASECGTTPGCFKLGTFSFLVRRVKAQ